jgi:hypothetical protein
VYIASRKPTGRTNSQKPIDEFELSNAPLLLNRSVKTKSALWCVSGTKTRRPITTATPSTCQPTEMLFILASARSPKMFTSV